MPETTDVLTPQTVELGASFGSRDEAIRRAGELLVENGHVDERYIDSMFEREKSVSTYMGNAVAIPHGTNESKALIRQTAISFIRYDEPIDWLGSPAKLSHRCSLAAWSRLGTEMP